MTEFFESIYEILVSIVNFIVTIVETLFTLVTEIYNYVWHAIVMLMQILPDALIPMIIILIIGGFVLFIINRK